MTNKMVANVRWHCLSNFPVMLGWMLISVRTVIDLSNPFDLVKIYFRNVFST